MRYLPFVLLLCSAPALAQIPDSVNLAPPKTVWDSDLDGTAIHRISTLPCPAAIGDFKRFNVQLYDKVGFDVGCDYRMPNAEITLYLTKINPTDLDEQFKIAKGAIEGNRPVKAVRDATLAAPPGFEWRRASYLLNSGMISDVLMAPFHGWYFEVRVSYMPVLADTTAKALAELSASALKTAGEHLAACEARAKPPADGVRVTDQAKLMGFALVGGALMGTTIDGSTGKLLPPAPPERLLSCADGSFSLGKGDEKDSKDNFVFWRDTGAQTSLRITGINRDFTATARSSLANLFAQIAAAKGGAPATGGLDGKPPSVLVVIDGGDRWKLMGAFDGLPSMEDMAKAALLGPAFATVSKTGKDIQLYMPSDKVPPSAK